MSYNRLLPILTPFFIWLLNELFFFKPKMIYVSVVLSICLVLFTIRQFAPRPPRTQNALTVRSAMNGILREAKTPNAPSVSSWVRGLRQISALRPIGAQGKPPMPQSITQEAELAVHAIMNKARGNFLIFPILFLSSTAAYSTIVMNKILIQFLFLLNVIFLYLYFRASYYRLTFPALPLYNNFKFQEISSLGNFIIYFFISSSLYGWLSFLNLPLWPLMLAVVLSAIIIIYQNFWAHKINYREAFIFIIIGSLILLEFAWSLSFLPLNFNISGLILAICYYMIMGLMSFYLLNKLDKRAVQSYLILGLGSIVILLLTARWFLVD